MMKLQLRMELKWITLMLLEITFIIVINSRMVVSERKASLQKGNAIKTIQSEDGDIIDCIDIYKQPAFTHPALKDHKIQLNPSNVPEEDPTVTMENKKMSVNVTTTQLWQKSGSCPKGTIPILRIQPKTNNVTQIHNYGKKRSIILDQDQDKKNDEKLMLMKSNHSVSILHAEGYAYYGAKAGILVWAPQVERDDEYSISHISLEHGNYNDYQSIECGWAVNPTLYGDRQSRLFTYWTADGGTETGCFDLTCPGFVQTSNEIALGAAIYPISNPGLLAEIIIYIYNDRDTGNWWIQYGEDSFIGYWPKDLFPRLQYHFTSVKWGGDVYSSRVGIHPGHTATGMGSGNWPESSPGWPTGSMNRMRVLGNNFVLRIPEWFYSYTDEYQCYESLYIHDYVVEPEFYYGGPGRTLWCT